MKKSKSKKGNGYRLDFTDVPDRILVPEGDWPVKIESVEVKEGNEYDYFAFRCKVNSPKERKAHGGALFFNTSLSPKSLWNLRNLLRAVGIKVPDGPMELDFDELIGCEFIATVEHEKYEGRTQARVIGYAPIDEDEGEEDEEVEVEDDDSEDEEDEKDEKDDDEDEEEEEAEELEAVSEDEVSEMSLKQLKKLVEDYSLDVDLDSFKTTKKKVSAIVEALEEKDLLAK